MNFFSALELNQHLSCGQDCHALDELTDGAFAPFRDRGRCLFQRLLCLHQAGTGALSVGAALQDILFLLFEFRLLGKDLGEFRVAAVLVRRVNRLCQKALELCIELRQALVDVGQAHRLPLHWQQLQ